MVANCCRCNRSGSCQGCSCVKASKTCTSCLPFRVGKCRNSSSKSSLPGQPLPTASITTTTTQPHNITPTISPSLQFIVTISSCNNSRTQPSLSTIPSPSFRSQLSNQPSGPVFPSLSSITASTIPTLQHIPKGARDAWALIVHECLSSISQDPSDLDT